MIGTDILIVCLLGAALYLGALAAVRARNGSRIELIRALIFITGVLLGAFFLVLASQFPQNGVFRALAVLMIVATGFSILLLTVIDLGRKK